MWPSWTWCASDGLPACRTLSCARLGQDSGKTWRQLQHRALTGRGSSLPVYSVALASRSRHRHPPRVAGISDSDLLPLKHAAGRQRGATADPAAMGAAGSKAEPPVKFDDNGKQLGRWLAEGRAARSCGAAAVDGLTPLFSCAGIRAKRSAARAQRPRASATSASRKMARKTVPTSSRRTRPVYARRASQSPDSPARHIADSRAAAAARIHAAAWRSVVHSRDWSAWLRFMKAANINIV